MQYWQPWLRLQVDNNEHARRLSRFFCGLVGARAVGRHICQVYIKF